MRRSVAAALKVSTSLMVLCGYWALTTTPDYGNGMMLIPVVALLAMPFAEWLHRRFKIFNVATQAVAFTYFLALPVSYASLSLLNWVIALVMFIQVYSLLRIKRRREYGHIYLMAFFLILAACSREPFPSIGLVMTVFLLSSIWSFVMLQIHFEGARNKYFAQADVAPIRPVSSTVIVPTTPRFDWGLMSLTSGISLGALALTAVLFMFVPRIEAGMFGTDTQPSSFRTGLSSEVNLSAGGQITQDTTPVMRVTFPEEPNGQYGGPMYWRATSFTGYMGSSWIRSPIRPEVELGEGFAPLTRTFSSRGSDLVLRRSNPSARREVEQEIYMDIPPQEGLPALPMPIEIQMAGGGKPPRIRWDFHADFTVQLSRSRGGGVNYRVRSELLRPTPEQLRRAPENYREAMDYKNFIMLTHENLREESIQIARNVTRNAPTVYDKAIAIQQYLSGNGFVYSLDVPPMPPNYPIDYFVQTAKEGHCELFASAMALMLRSLEIPTRVASGYRGGDWNEADESYIISADMAHLWVEVFFLGYGWVTFDPSPPSLDDELPATQRLAAAISRYLLRTKMLWYQNVVGYQPEFNLGSIREMGLRIFSLGSEPESEQGVLRPVAIRGISGQIIAALLILAMAGATALSARRFWRRRRQERGLTADQRRALRLYLRLRKRAARVGAEWKGRTAEELRDELIRITGESSETVDEVLSIYNAARFGRRELKPERYSLYRKLVDTWRPAKGHS